MTPYTVSYHVMLVTDAIAYLSGSPHNLRCQEVCSLLEGLGFIITRASSGNHRKYTHPKLLDFFGSNFDCGHGRNAFINAAYIRNIIRVLKKYSVELTELQRESQSD